MRTRLAFLCTGPILVMVTATACSALDLQGEYFSMPASTVTATVTATATATATATVTASATVTATRTLFPPSLAGAQPSRSSNSGAGAYNESATQRNEFNAFPLGRDSQPTGSANCDPNYEGGCVPMGVGDVDCGDISFKVYVVGVDVYGLDGDDNGVGCQSN